MSKNENIKQREYNAAYPALCQIFGLGAFGIDRMVSGCVASGIAKLLTLLLAVAILVVSVSSLSLVGITFGYVVLFAWAMWVIIDYFYILLICLANVRNTRVRKHRMFCGGPNRYWTNTKHGAIIMLVAIVIHLVISITNRTRIWSYMPSRSPP